MSSSLLNTYLQFLRSPNLIESPEDIAPKKALIQTVRLYTIHFLLVMVAGFFITQFSGAQDNSIINAAIADMPAWVLFVSAVVAAPVLEECVFRLPMRPYAVNVAFSASFVIAFLLLASAPSQSLLLFIGGMILGGNFYLWTQRPHKLILQQFYVRYAIAIFYFLTLIFGAIHITNYEPRVWPLLPLLVLPQVIVALWLGFVRMRYGFKWAIFGHALHNGCLLLPILVTKAFGSAELQADGLENLDMKALSAVDQLLVGGIGVYMAGGFVACGWGTWGLLQERKLS